MNEVTPRQTIPVFVVSVPGYPQEVHFRSNVEELIRYLTDRNLLNYCRWGTAVLCQDSTHGYYGPRWVLENDIS